MKPGYKTTEFWLSAVAVVVSLLIASGLLESLAETHWVVKAVSLVAAALAALGYDSSRAKVKEIENGRGT